MLSHSLSGNASIEWLNVTEAIWRDNLGERWEWQGRRCHVLSQSRADNGTFVTNSHLIFQERPSNFRFFRFGKTNRKLSRSISQQNITHLFFVVLGVFPSIEL